MKMLNIREATIADVQDIEQLINGVEKKLDRNGVQSYFNRIREAELIDVLEKHLSILVEGTDGVLLGYLLIKKIERNEEDVFKRVFSEYKFSTGYIIDSFAVKCDYQQQGVGALMINKARENIKNQGGINLLGLVHPDNYAGKSTLKKVGRLKTGKTFCFCTTEGKTLLRQHFMIHI